MTEEVWVGDRYISPGDGLRITITRVDDDGWFEYSYMGVDHTVVYHTRAVLPVPTTWTRVGRGTELVEMCGHCHQAPAEPGQVLCWRCIAMHADEWATLSEEGALSKTIRLASGMTVENYRRKPVEELEKDDD